MSTQWIRSNDVVWEELNGEVLVVSPRSGARWLLNATGAAIWKFCDGTRNIADLVTKLADAGFKDACIEIAAFCDAFEQLGLLQAVTGARPAELIPCHAAFQSAPHFRPLNAGGGGRRRPSPRGVSGPV